MRKFSSYGPVNAKLHYYAPRKQLIERALLQLMGENPDEEGHYITVWAPRQTGKSWTMREILWRLQKDERFDVLKVNLEHLKTEKRVGAVLKSIGKRITEKICPEIIEADTQEKFEEIFRRGVINKPLVLILDEFDALEEEAIESVVASFRNIHNIRQDQADKSTGEKDYLLHGVALIGVRSVLGVENVKGSPFNVQRSLRIPNLTFEEVEGMFRWYEEESGRKVEDDALERLYYETNGQPGLISWFGELLTEGWEEYFPPKDSAINMDAFKRAWGAANAILPNNNILNIISKARQEPYKELVLKMFQTREKIEFKYDDPNQNFLYMNGVIEREEESPGKYCAKFASPFVQKRLFNYFSHEMFSETGNLLSDPFRSMDDVITAESLNIKNMIGLYREYLLKNKEPLLRDAPRRRVDDRVYEAVFHFSLYSWLNSFLRSYKASVVPEFPTGNGKIDLIVKHAGRTWGIELKSYANHSAYQEVRIQAARYGKELGLKKISLIFFVEYIDDANRKRLEADFTDPETLVEVEPIFVETGP